MMEIRDDIVKSFVCWMQENAARLSNEPADIAAEQIGEALLRISTQLGIEVLEEIEDGSIEAIVTSFSDPSLFSLVRLIVDLLKDTKGWKFTALKQPRGFKFKIFVGGHQLNADSLEFSQIPGIYGGFRLILSEGNFVSDHRVASI